MSSAPAISVVMPTYNAARYIAEAVRSVLDQQGVELELIIIDDGSTDDTEKVLKSFTDPRIRYVRHNVNRGLVAVLNDGLDLARGAFIARMDADDIMLPRRLATQHAFLNEHSAIDLVAAFVELMNSEGETTGVWDTDRATVSESEIRAMMPRTNCIAHPTVMMRRTALEGLRYHGRHEDWNLWLQLLARGNRLAKIPEVLVRQRVHASSYMGGLKGQVPLELRLLRSRREFLFTEWGKGRFSGLHLNVLHAQLRTLARHVKVNLLLPFLRSTYRCLTYSPLALLREQRSLRIAERTWKGHALFFFPYLHTGGAEQVHNDIVATVADQKPLVVISGFSTDRTFAKSFSENGILLELPRSLHHPFYARRTLRRLAALTNAQKEAVVFAALSTTFFELLPHLRPEVRAIHLQHAFLYQPTGNAQHKQWLPHFNRMEKYIFISGQAKSEYERFLLANNIPRSQFGKLLFIPNAVQQFGSVQEHERTGLLFVGRPSPEKRMDLFLALCARLETEAPGRFHFTVVGAHPVQGHKHVQFMGRIDDAAELAQIYQDHDLLALTSTREGFPLVIMEAMAQGLVVLSTPVGDVPHRMDPDFAVVTSSIDPSIVLHEMTHAAIALDLDRPRLQRMKTKALQKARTDFAPDRFRQRYRELLGGKVD